MHKQNYNATTVINFNLVEIYMSAPAKPIFPSMKVLLVHQNRPIYIISNSTPVSPPKLAKTTLHTPVGNYDNHVNQNQT